MYFNARSLIPKIDELRLICATNSPHIVCVVETWLGDEVSDSEISIIDYYVTRLDRNRHGGGIAFYIRSDLATFWNCTPTTLWFRVYVAFYC